MRVRRAIRGIHDEHLASDTGTRLGDILKPARLLSLASAPYPREHYRRVNRFLKQLEIVPLTAGILK